MEPPTIVERMAMGLVSFMVEGRDAEYQIAASEICLAVEQALGRGPLEKGQAIQQRNMEEKGPIQNRIYADIRLLIGDHHDNRADHRLVLRKIWFLICGLVPDDYFEKEEAERVEILRNIHLSYCRQAIHDSMIPKSKDAAAEVFERIPHLVDPGWYRQQLAGMTYDMAIHHEQDGLSLTLQLYMNPGRLGDSVPLMFELHQKAAREKYSGKHADWFEDRFTPRNHYRDWKHTWLMLERDRLRGYMITSAPHIVAGRRTAKIEEFVFVKDPADHDPSRDAEMLAQFRKMLELEYRMWWMDLIPLTGAVEQPPH